MVNWNIVKITLKDILYKVKENPIMDAAVRASISQIPFLGEFLISLYDNAPGEEDEKYEKIKKLIENLSELKQSDLASLYDSINANKQEILKNQKSLNTLLSRSTEMVNILKNIATGQISIKDGQDKIFELIDTIREEGKKDIKSILNQLEIVQNNIVHNFDNMSYNIKKFDLSIPADLLLFYLRLKEHLLNSLEVFHNQNRIQSRLVNSLTNNQQPIEGKYYDEIFYNAHYKMNEEERDMFNFLRRTTEDSKRFNSYARVLLQNNLAIFDYMNELKILYEHYCYWLAKYELLKDDPDMCLVYVEKQNK
jgi:hypothetical protein